ncbi:hypothetical protein YTPLAS18_32320 [Nitrospira sp.]|nr:hypothetical protein YTPLAS18_32320 [Nitrospira sp.]
MTSNSAYHERLADHTYMNAPNFSNRNQRDNNPSSHKDRRGRRVRTECRLFLFGEDDFEVEARSHDLSAGGCSAECSVPLTVGMELRLSMFLGDHQWPVRVDGAVIRWVSGTRFGLEFFQIRPAVQDRIRQYIRDHRFEEA